MKVMLRVLGLVFLVVTLTNPRVHTAKVVIAAPVATYTEAFDTVGYWYDVSGSGFTSYGIKEYRDPAHPEVVFRAEGALRQTSAAQDGFPGTHSGAYAWRLNQAAGSLWQAKISTGGVGTFSFWVRRWDNSPDPNYVAEFSTNNGAAWTSVQIINNAWLASSDWKQISGSINTSNATGDADDIIIRVRWTAGERLMVDDFQMTDYPAPDTAPSVTSSTPTSGATGVATSATLTVNFSEPVSVSAGGVTLECPAGNAVALSGLPASNTSSVTLTPTAPLPAGTTCTAKVVANNVSDQDTIDPPDKMAADYTWTFTTDAAPVVSSTTPADGASDVAVAADVAVVFTEAVNVSTSSFTISCANTGAHTFTVSGSGASTVTLNPDVDFGNSESCTVTVVAAQVGDVDANDPPDNMAANYVFTFTTIALDTPPAVTTTAPTSGATGIPLNTTIAVNFSEAVDVAADGVTLECPAGSPVTLGGLPATNVTGVTLTPSANLPAGTTCAAKVLAAGVTDRDGAPNPMTADYTWAFITDAPPAVSSTAPANNATGVAANANVSITFSEAVTPSGSWYSISCASSGAHAAAVSGGPTAFALDPTADFTAGETCTVTIVAAQIADQDANDPPDNMVANYVFSFTVANVSTCTQLFFSEYVEGSSNNKAFEIFNGSNAAVNLNGYSVELYTNGSATPNPTVNLTGSLAAGDVYVIANSGAGATILAAADLTSGVANYNGDDALVLKHNGTVIDVFGQVGFDPGTNWGSGMTSTLDHTLRRKLDIAQGDPIGNDAFDPALEWDGFAIDTFDGLGSHTASCGGDVAPRVLTTTPANGASGVAANADVSIVFSEAVTTSGSWHTISCATSGGHSAVVSGGPTTYTLNPDADFTAGEVCTVTVVAAQVTDQDGAPQNMAADYTFSFTVAGGDLCAGAPDLIHDIQGSGAASGMTGQSKTILGLVVGDFQVSGQLNGFFVQEEAADWDANAATSEGIFVFQGDNTVADLNVGDKVRLTGNVAEWADRTQGGATLTQLTSPTNVLVCSTGNTVTPTDVTLPEAAEGDLERYEGMLVRIVPPVTVAQTYYLGRYGQMSLSGGGRLFQPTNQHLPGSAEAISLANYNARSLLILDDGKAGVRCGDNPNPVPYLGAAPGAIIRAGDSVTNLVGVIDYGQIDSGATGTCSSGTTLFSGDYRLQPTQSPTFTAVNPRPAAPATVGGNIRVVGANLLNFFNGDGNKGGFPTSRGADNFTEFVRQRIKLYEELSRLDGDIVTLMEVENDGFGATSAIAELVKVLNEGPCWNSPTECANLSYSSSGMGVGTYQFVNMGSPIGADEITVGIVYKPGKVALVGTPRALTDAAYTDPNNTGTQKSRPALAASFEENVWGERFTVVANHLKSKGSCPTSGVDADQGDGQGCWNDTRKKGAAYLVNTWLPTDPTGAGDPDYLLTGDMNAYAKEDPITAFVNGGYANLVLQWAGAEAYSYVFDGQLGYLDHALAKTGLAAQVTGTTEWHVNADEPTVIDYNTDFNPAGYYVPNQYRASDHDPVLVGLGLYADLSDNPTYGQAWHTGQGAWRLGAGWSGEASGGSGTDSDDGVVRNYADSWNDGRGEVYVTVNGPVVGQWACLNAWLDYSDGSVTPNVPETPDNQFNSNEHVIDNYAIQAGATGQLVTFPLEAGVLGNVQYNMRTRLVPAPNPADGASCATVTVAAPDGGAQPTGRADGGEIEDVTFSAGPLAVRLASFTADRTADGVLLAWETVAEMDNAGFNLYRSESAAGPWVRLNAELIPALAPGSGNGNVYRWTDANADLARESWYVLEDVALNGQATRHGPVGARANAPNAVHVTAFAAQPVGGALLLPVLAAVALVAVVLFGRPR